MADLTTRGAARRRPRPAVYLPAWPATKTPLHQPAQKPPPPKAPNPVERLWATPRCSGPCPTTRAAPCSSRPSGATAAIATAGSTPTGPRCATPRHGWKTPGNSTTHVAIGRHSPGCGGSWKPACEPIAERAEDADGAGATFRRDRSDQPKFQILKFPRAYSCFFRASRAFRASSMRFNMASRSSSVRGFSISRAREVEHGAAGCHDPPPATMGFFTQEADEPGHVRGLPREPLRRINQSDVFPGKRRSSRPLCGLFGPMHRMPASASHRTVSEP